MSLYHGGCLISGSFEHKRFTFGIGALVLLTGCLACGSALGKSVSNGREIVELSLKDYLHQVLQHNESLQAQMLAAEVKRHKWRAGRGIFEPQLETSITREANKRLNNTQQQAAMGGNVFFKEQNTIYDGGLETLIPSGGKVQLGATMSDLANNVNPVGFYGGGSLSNLVYQYQTFVGATLTQPLLKNGWFTATLAPLRLAALDSDIAFQQYRRQLMLTVYQAESVYWNLYFAQEQVQFFDKSVAVAQEVLNDSREKLKAGQGAELDVMEAQSALALRNTKRNEAVQNYYDALGHLRTLNGSVLPPNLAARAVGPTIRVVDVPPETNAPLSYPKSFNEALLSNPDFLIQRKKMSQEGIRVSYAKNQLLPELDLKAAYGYNGLGGTPGDSWSVATSQQYPSWSVGLELTLPLAGNIEGRNFLKAAKLSLQQAYVKLHGTETQIGNSLEMAIQKTRAWRGSIQSYQTLVQYNGELLKTELERLKAGTVDAHKVLEVEADLLDARQNLADALVQYRESLLQVQLTDGSILKRWHLDVTRDQLRRQTDGWLRREAAPNDEFQN